ncbi:MAG TPA: hypothetical protein DEF34_09585 [Desulfotomaculum sp.]|nr:MAG: hypothetical protein VR67_10825 [Peptococcaceae bacterium BRH_c8a]HBX23864.1 hypothetical protein [Desulfotomaculum sp.]
MNITWSLIRELEEKVGGGSFYLLDLARFRQNFRDLLTSFTERYPGSSIAYSYKTNYIPRLCRLVEQMGGYAEVVSLLEYELAERIGVNPRKIIYNGPCKGLAGIEKALLAGSVVNLDSLGEVHLVEDVAARYPDRLFPVGLRCNFPVEPGLVSRFGFDIDGAEFGRALKIIGGMANCRLSGLHCHFPTPHKSPASYARRTAKMVELYRAHCRGGNAGFLDIGGGFFSRMNDSLAAQFPFPIPGFDDYAQAIAPQLTNAFPDGGGPELILEPGTALVADTMYFVTKVVDCKEVGTQRVALAAGSVHNIKPTLHNKNLPLQVIGKNGFGGQTGGRCTDITGYTCLENDYLYRGYDGAIDAGDYLVFGNVGAYTVVLKPPFIRPSPAIAAYDAGPGSCEVVRRPESFADVFGTYVI